MRFSTLSAVLLVSFAAISLAESTEAQPEQLAARDIDDVVLSARELLDDLGMHTRSLKNAALSARRIDHLEARMLDLEADLEDLALRAKATKSDKYVCSKCDATFNTSRELTSHKDTHGHHKDIAPAARRRH